MENIETRLRVEGQKQFAENASTHKKRSLVILQIEKRTTV